MAEQKLVLNNFSGGMSISEKSGFIGAGRLVQRLNIHQDRNSMLPLPGNTKVSGTTVTNLVTWMVDGNPYDTSHYLYDQVGNIYKETSGGGWSVDRTVSGGDGSGLFVFDNYLYYTTPTKIGRKGRLSGTSTYNDDFFSDGTLNLDQSFTATGSTYTLPTSISETGSNRGTFTPTKDPIAEIDVLLAAKGTGNWTITVHDSKDISIGTATVANASLVTAGNYQPFTFSTALRVVNNAPYHFHLTSTVADGTVTTNTPSDLSTVAYKEYFGILISTTWHMMEMLNGLIIANERYLAFWDEVTYDPNRIVLPAGFHVQAISKEKEFIVAAAWRGSDTDHITESRYYYWDGIASSFNYWRPAPRELPNAVTSYKNRVTSILGRRGKIYYGTDPFQTIFALPTLTTGKKIELNPGAISEWEGRIMMGIGTNTDDANLIQGIYGFGNNTDSDTEVLSQDFIMSTGTTQSTSAAVGMVKGVGKYLYFSWKDGSTYGVDRVATTDNPASTSSWQSLIFDGGDADQQNFALKVVVTYTPLPSGASITPKYRIDRATNFTSGTVDSTTGSTSCQVFINALFHEIEFGFDATCGSTNFKVTGIKLYWNDIPDSR